MTEQQKKWLRRSAAALVIGVLAVLAWQRYGPHEDDEGLIGSNGRIEAVEIDVATRMPGRLKEVRVNEGDLVTAGQVVALMDTDVLEAQRRQAEAQLQQAQSAVAAARSQLAQHESDKVAARAAVVGREAELKTARGELARSLKLAETRAVSQQVVDNDQLRVDSGQAALDAARAQVAASEAAIASARAQVGNAQAAAAAAQANIERIQVDIDDAATKAPRDGRVQFRVAQVGEVLAAGGRVLNMLDLNDVYMSSSCPPRRPGASRWAPKRGWCSTRRLSM